MTDIILRFSGSSNIAAWSVKVYTWSWCSHVETELMRDNKPILYGALPTTGVDYRPFNSTDGDRVERYRIQVDEDIKTSITQQLLSQRGKPYYYTAILGLAIHRDWGNDDSKWFCSELVTWAFKHGGCELIRSDHKDRISPRDLLLSPLLIPVT